MGVGRCFAAICINFNISSLNLLLPTSSSLCFAFLKWKLFEKFCSIFPASKRSSFPLNESCLSVTVGAVTAWKGSNVRHRAGGKIHFVFIKNNNSCPQSHAIKRRERKSFTRNMEKKKIPREICNYLQFIRVHLSHPLRTTQRGILLMNYANYSGCHRDALSYWRSVVQWLMECCDCCRFACWGALASPAKQTFV